MEMETESYQVNIARLPKKNSPCGGPGQSFPFREAAIRGTRGLNPLDQDYRYVFLRPPAWRCLFFVRNVLERDSKLQI